MRQITTIPVIQEDTGDTSITRVATEEVTVITIVVTAAATMATVMDMRMFGMSRLTAARKKKLIDIHTHLMPGIDDGCETPEETKKVCEIMQLQGVDRIIATPHFYADSSDPEDFIIRRDRAFKSMGDLVQKYNIRKGAEVRYFTGIGMADGIDLLKIEGSDFMLLELADRKVNGIVIDDLLQLRNRNIRPIIAHLNRYSDYYNDSFIEFCNINSIPIQLNTECLFRFFPRRRALRLIMAEAVQFIATDCHDSERRRPDLKEAFDVIRKHLGDDIAEEFAENEERII